MMCAHNAKNSAEDSTLTPAAPCSLASRIAFFNLVRRTHCGLAQRELQRRRSCIERWSELAMCSRICKQQHCTARRKKLGQYLQALGVKLGAHDAYAGDISARISHIGYKFCPHQVFRHRHNRNYVGCGFDGKAGGVAESGNYGWALRNEFRREGWQAGCLAVGIADIKSDVAAFSFYIA